MCPKEGKNPILQRQAHLRRSAIRFFVCFISARPYPDVERASTLRCSPVTVGGLAGAVTFARQFHTVASPLPGAVRPKPRLEGVARILDSRSEAISGAGT
jgi:hypothetical protein